jgi:hypothetical protein
LLMPNSWLALLVQADNTRVMLSKAIVKGFMIEVETIDSN